MITLYLIKIGFHSTFFKVILSYEDAGKNNNQLYSGKRWFALKT